MPVDYSFFFVILMWLNEEIKQKLLLRLEISEMLPFIQPKLVAFFMLKSFLCLRNTLRFYGEYNNKQKNTN